MKNKLYMVGGCLLFCAATLGGMYATSPLSKGLYRDSFVRNFVEEPLMKINEFDLGVNSYYLSGATRSKIYLSNYTSPFHLLTMPQNLTDSQHIVLRGPFDSMISPMAIRTTVDSPFFFMAHGQMAEYLRGRLSDWKAERYLEETPDYSVEALPIGDDAIILKSMSKETGEYELGKKTITQGLSFKNEILQKQIDGIFCVEGKLLFDHATGTIVYVHQYRNEIILLDSALNVLNRLHTIDNFSHARVEVANISGETMLSQPPNIINLISAVNNGLLYVRSNVLSASEKQSLFLSNSVIDVYDLVKRRYLRSFYIPDIGNKKTSSFIIHQDKIQVLTDRFIETYKLPNEIIGYLKLTSHVKNISRAKSGNAEHLQKK